nr:branched-chain amino acid aminotransferase 4-amino-4-deoxychorismate lyase, putative [Ipomoea batatas]GMD16882.1 branched-chain amino acid aminotransferase 4-amino-4-deoxychorismate lyase, putative [Ipomoea batatas]
MAIHFSNYYSPNCNTLLECLSLIESGLTNTTIHNKYHKITYRSFRDLTHLFKESSFLFVASTGVNNYEITIFLLESFNTFHRYFHRIRLCVAPIERYFSFGCILLQLIKSTSSKCICTN